MGYIRIYSVFSNKQYVQISGHSPLPPCPLYLLYISPLSFQILFWYCYGFVPFYDPLSLISTFVWSQVSSNDWEHGGLTCGSTTALVPQNLPVASSWVRESAVNCDENRDLWMLLALIINESKCSALTGTFMPPLLRLRKCWRKNVSAKGCKSSSPGHDNMDILIMILWRLCLHQACTILGSLSDTDGKGTIY